jgi:hypothetical protein
MRSIICLLIVVFLTGCEKYELPTYAPLTLNGGQWMLTDYEIKVVSCQGCNTANDVSKISVVKTDTVGLQSFRFKELSNNTVTLTQDFSTTSHSRLFILNRNGINSTKWEFETYELSTYFEGNTGIKNCWVKFLSDTKMEVSDIKQIGNRSLMPTTWTYYTDKKLGTQPRDLLFLLSSPVTTDVLIGNRATDKLITYRLQLVFMR